MKLIKINFAIFFLLVFTLVSCTQETKVKNNSIKSVKNESVINLISPQEFNKTLDNITPIDIRTPQEFAEGHLKNAVNINFYDPNFIKKMNNFDKTKKLYIYCRTGNRTGSASRKLKKMGFIKIYDLQGGILNWRKNNMEVIK